MMTFSSKHLMNVINDVLSLAKIDGRKYELNYKNIDFPTLIENLANIHQQQAQKKGLEFIFKYDNTIAKNQLSDETAIVQILNNLLSNAIKFTHEGTVLFQVRKINTAQIEFIITDTGIGVSKEKEANLYEPFLQGFNYLNKDFGGTGLGLSIVKGLVDLMGGQISMKTISQVGTSFTVQFPFNFSEVQIIERNLEKIVQHSNHPKNLNIIAAEDNVVKCYLRKLQSKKTGT